MSTSLSLDLDLSLLCMLPLVSSCVVALCERLERVKWSGWVGSAIRGTQLPEQASVSQSERSVELVGGFTVFTADPFSCMIWDMRRMHTMIDLLTYTLLFTTSVDESHASRVDAVQSTDTVFTAMDNKLTSNVK